MAARTGTRRRFREKRRLRIPSLLCALAHLQLNDSDDAASNLSARRRHTSASLPWGLKRIALMHMSINLTVVALYVVNYWMRAHDLQADAQNMAPFWLSLAAVAMLVVSGWLGGKMIYVHGVAVESPPEPAPPSGHHGLEA